MSDLYRCRTLTAPPLGARDLAPLYELHAEPGEEPIGEVWLTWAGSLLGNLCRRFGRDLVGTAARETDRLLMKFLFAREKLSVQVHPDDETAQRYGEPCGKTECWYIVSSEPGACIGLGRGWPAAR